MWGGGGREKGEGRGHSEISLLVWTKKSGLSQLTDHLSGDIFAFTDAYIQPKSDFKIDLCPQFYFFLLNPHLGHLLFLLVADAGLLTVVVTAGAHLW